MLQFLRDLFDPLFNIMGFTLQTFHSWGAPWWLAIAMLTVVVRTFLFPLTIRQVKSMRKVQDLKPAMDELRKEHKDDPQMLDREMMRLYRERGANPLGGCLPIFVQLPTSSSSTTPSGSSTSSRASGPVVFSGSRT